MNYYLVLLVFISVLSVAVFGIKYFVSKMKERRIRRILSEPFKEEHRRYLKKIPYYSYLSKEDREKIERFIKIFINTKEFIGVNLKVTDEMKVVIAFYACLLLLHIAEKECYENLKTVIIYPDTVAVERIREQEGIYSKERFLIEGEAANGTVVLVWNDVKKEAYHLRNDNVVIHEFAHEIDFMDGALEGIPPIGFSKYGEWAATVFKDYKKLRKAVLRGGNLGKYELLGDYAATDEAEFFAVLTERFFESPHALKKEFPELYEKMKEFYKIDPSKLVKG